MDIICSGLQVKRILFSLIPNRNIKSITYLLCCFNSTNPFKQTYIKHNKMRFVLLDFWRGFFFIEVTPEEAEIAKARLDNQRAKRRERYDRKKTCSNYPSIENP